MIGGLSLVAAVGGLLWWSPWEPREPVYEGRPLTYWLAGPTVMIGTNASALTSLQNVRAYTSWKRQVVGDSNAVPFLIKALSKHGWFGEPYYREHMWPKLPSWAREHLPAPAWNAQIRQRSALLLGYIGPSAKSAVPALTRAMKNDEDGLVRMSAAAALNEIEKRGERPVATGPAASDAGGSSPRPPSRRPENPVLRLESDTELAATKRERLEESIDQLIRDSQQYFWYLDSHNGAQNNLERMLAARRAVRVLQTIKKLPPEEREAKCYYMFARAFAVHTNTFRAIMLHDEDPSAPRNNQSMLATQESLAAAMFATAEFGRRDMLSQQFAQFDRFRENLELRWRTHPSPQKEHLLDYFRPDNRFVVNVLRLAALADGGDGGKAAGMVDAECRRAGMTTTQVPVVAWDARATWFEQRRGLGDMDVSRGVTTYVFYDWNPEDRLHPELRQDKVLETVRSLVLPPSSAPEAGAKAGVKEASP
jgi:hypothetical protein